MFLAIGSNEESVRLSGINVRKYKFMGYAISGVLSAWCGLMMAGRTNVSSPLVGNGAEMDAIAAVVIGGASLAGGRGSVPNTLMGAIILGIISNIMNLMNIPAYPQNVVKGIIIILAVVIQQFDKKK
jgi:ribose transport system permease protein